MQQLQIIDVRSQAPKPFDPHEYLLEMVNKIKGPVSVSIKLAADSNQPVEPEGPTENYNEGK